MYTLIYTSAQELSKESLYKIIGIISTELNNSVKKLNSYYNVNSGLYNELLRITYKYKNNGVLKDMGDIILNINNQFTFSTDSYYHFKNKIHFTNFNNLLKQINKLKYYKNLLDNTLLKIEVNNENDISYDLSNGVFELYISKEVI